MEIGFIADSMLGRLAKWLRVLGYDTYYQPFYREGVLDRLTSEGRRLLSRHRPRVSRYPGSIFILSERVQDQLAEMKNRGAILPDRSRWFTRCLICNLPLERPILHEARENVPEYVFYQSRSDIRLCPSCGRFFWPGSHREKMIEQLEEWGF